MLQWAKLNNLKGLYCGRGHKPSKLPEFHFTEPKASRGLRAEVGRILGQVCIQIGLTLKKNTVP